MKIDPCVNFWFGVSLFCFFWAVSGSGVVESESAQSKTSTVDQNSSTSEILESLSKDVKALGQRNREVEKSHEELKEQFKSSQGKCNEQFASLSKKLDEFKSEISEDHGISLLMPPLRGPPGKQGEKGQRGPKGERGFSAQSVTSCSVVTESFSSPRSKKQVIYPHGNGTSLEVLCDFETDGGGWTLIQKRSSGPKEEFNRTWTEYQNGFGSLDGNFWLGLENIHALTQNGDQELRITLEDFEGEKKWAKYSSFSISNASDFYRLRLGGFSGDSTAGDSMTSSDLSWAYHNTVRFSTKDRDNDNHSGANCAVELRGGGGWWFTSCGGSGLNGLYFEKGETVQHKKGIYWYSWRGESYSLAKSEMKIRTRKS